MIYLLSYLLVCVNKESSSGVGKFKLRTRLRLSNRRIYILLTNSLTYLIV